MRAVKVKDIQGVKRLSVEEVDAPLPGSDELIIEVKAFSLNNGEVRGALDAPDGHRPGWDFSGLVQAAPSGSGFATGDRVVGLKLGGAWAERIAVGPAFLSRIPDSVSFEKAAVLPVAGLTATIAISKRPLARGDKVLVTAATGGVGSLAIQLAADAGAHVTAYVRRKVDAPMLERLGANVVAIGEDEAAKHGPYDLILEGVGGTLLGSALSWLAPRGVCVQFGDAGGEELTSFDAKAFRLGGGDAFGGTSLYGFFLVEELTRPNPAAAAEILASLGDRLAAGTLDPTIEMLRSWRDVEEVAGALMSRRIKGKAVLRVD